MPSPLKSPVTRLHPLAVLAAALLVLGLAAPGQAAPKKQTPPAQPATTASGAPRSDYRFAVEEFRVADDIAYPGWYGYQTGLNNAVCDMLTTEMVKQGRDMVERERIKDVLNEQDLGQGGRLDKSTAAPIGKIVGADYLIVGTITEWGIKERNIGGGVLHGLFGGLGQAGNYHDSTARVKIDYHVVNARTGRIVSGSANTGQGEEANRGVALQSDWWNSINFNESEWTSSQIGKATRKAVQQIAQQLADWTPNDGGAEPDRADVSATVVALISPDEFAVDKGKADDLRVGDTLELVSRTPVRNAQGKVVMEREIPVGTAQITEVQDKTAILHVTKRTGALVKLKEGDAVRTPHP